MKIINVTQNMVHPFKIQNDKLTKEQKINIFSYIYPTTESIITCFCCLLWKIHNTDKKRKSR
jgi:hypothetical protein